MSKSHKDSLLERKERIKNVTEEHGSSLVHCKDEDSYGAFDFLESLVSKLNACLGI